MADFVKNSIVNASIAFFVIVINKPFASSFFNTKTILTFFD